MQLSGLSAWRSCPTSFFDLTPNTNLVFRFLLISPTLPPSSHPLLHDPNMTSYVYSNADAEQDGLRYCSCCRFTNGIDLPSPRELTVREISIEAPRYSARVLKNWCELNACLKRFEVVIRKRWSRKSEKQRREVLLRAWPEIPRQHRPDFVGARARKRSSTIPRKLRNGVWHILYPLATSATKLLWHWWQWWVC